MIEASSSKMPGLLWFQKHVNMHWNTCLHAFELQTVLDILQPDWKMREKREEEKRRKQNMAKCIFF